MNGSHGGSSFLDRYDGLILDADGVIYRGQLPVDHAIETLSVALERLPWCVVTNNAANPPSYVAERISRMGLPTGVENVITSPEGAVVFLRRQLPPGAPVLVVGGSGIDDALAAGGFTPVRDRTLDPVAVVQGLGMDVGWRELANAAYAIADGALWVATNLDRTIPLEDGFAPGNGSLVAAVQETVGRPPDAVTGKPEPLLFELAAERMGSVRPLVIGDRVDTDIQGANRAGMESLLVLTGVVQETDLSVLAAGDPIDMPTYVASDLRALLSLAGPERFPG